MRWPFRSRSRRQRAHLPAPTEWRPTTKFSTQPRRSAGSGLHMVQLLCGRSTTSDRTGGHPYQTREKPYTNVRNLTDTTSINNGNGIVDAADYVVWRETDGTRAEYDRWRAHFSETAADGSAASGIVPEPATARLLRFVAANGFMRRPRCGEQCHRSRASRELQS